MSAAGACMHACMRDQYCSANRQTPFRPGATKVVGVPECITLLAQHAHSPWGEQRVYTFVAGAVRGDACMLLGGGGKRGLKNVDSCTRAEA